MYQVEFSVPYVVDVVWAGSHNELHSVDLENWGIIAKKSIYLPGSPLNFTCHLLFRCVGRRRTCDVIDRERIEREKGSECCCCTSEIELLVLQFLKEGCIKSLLST